MNRLLDTVRSTVRHEMTEAVMAYEDKSREQWLFDYPAQVNGHSPMHVWTFSSPVTIIFNIRATDAIIMASYYVILNGLCYHYFYNGWRYSICVNMTCTEESRLHVKKCKLNPLLPRFSTELNIFHLRIMTYVL